MISKQLKNEEASLLNLVSDLIIYRNYSGKVVWCNQAVFDLLDTTEEEVYDHDCHKLWSNQEQCPGCPAEQTLQTGEEVEEVMSTGDGRYWRVKTVPQETKAGEIKAVIEIRTEITAKQKMKKKVKRRIEEQQLLLDNIDTQVWYLKDKNTYGKANQAHADFLGFQKEELKDKKLTSCLQKKGEIEACLNSNQLAFMAKEQVETEEWLTNKQGEKRLLSITRTPCLNETGEVEYVICSAHDITEEKKSQEKIKYLSFHDNLTGLYNRLYLRKEIERLDTGRQLPISIIMGDINGLKLVNDALGHKKGDEFIQKAAQTLKQSCRQEDIIVRWGGDEFIILLPQTYRCSAKKIIERIKNNCRQVEVGGFPLSIAFGSAVKESTDQEMDRIFQEAEKIVYEQKLTASKSTRADMLAEIINTLEKKTDETKEHSLRLTKLAFMLGEKVEISNARLDRLSLLATLHDVGKIAVPTEVLLKTEKLDPVEWEQVKKHAEVGYRIVKSVDKYSHIAEELLAHHEWWDGTGYPQGLAGKEIPLVARIIAIVDAYEVMTHGRVYKEPVSKKKALAELNKRAGTQFDPQLVEAFINLVQKRNNI